MTRHDINHRLGVCSRCGALAIELMQNPALPCLTPAEKARGEIRNKAGLEVARTISEKEIEAVHRAMRRGG